MDPKPDMWYVIGGVYYDGTWTKMEPGTSECYGPYFTEQEAKDEQIGKIWRNIDICWHHLFVVKIEET